VWKEMVEVLAVKAAVEHVWGEAAKVGDGLWMDGRSCQ
jgi:hypothetical protein